MFKKNSASHGETRISKSDALQGIAPLRGFLILLKAISEDLGVLPSAYQSAAKTSLRVQFLNSCVDAQDLIESYGTLLGNISAAYPVSINGSIGQLEEGTIEITAEEKHYCFSKQSASGHNFDTLSDFYFKISFESANLCDFAKEVLFHLPMRQNFVVMSGKWSRFDFAKDLFIDSDVLYFRYLPLSVEKQDVFSELPDLLSVEQIAELWTRFLQGGASWAEFETVQSLVATGYTAGIYKWELALKLAVENIGITISYEGNSVHALYQNGERVKLGYNKTTGAEKLFAKILSPA